MCNLIVNPLCWCKRFGIHWWTNNVGESARSGPVTQRLSQAGRQTIPRSAHHRHRRTWTTPLLHRALARVSIYQTVAEPEQLPVSSNLEG